MADVLDKSRPYGTVRGMSEARFYQNGRHYNAQGRRVRLDGEEVKPPVAEPQADEQPKIDENNNADNIPLEDLHWTQLKKMVEENGGQYEGKTEAVRFLRGEA